MEFIPVFLISGEFISFPFFVEFLDQMVTISRIIFLIDFSDLTSGWFSLVVSPGGDDK